MAVIATFELHDDLAAGGGAGEADRGHRRFRARADEAHLLDRREGFDDELCEIGFGGSGGAEAGAVARGLDDGLDDFGIGVAEDERTP